MVLFDIPSFSSAECNNLLCLGGTGLLCDVLQKRCFLVTMKKCLEAKSSVGPTLFKLKSKPILTSLPKDRGSLVKLKRALNTTPPPSKLENLPEFHSETGNGALFVGEGFYPLFSLGLLTICAWIPMRY